MIDLATISKTKSEKEANLLNSTKGEYTNCSKCNGKTFVYKAVYDEKQGYWSCIAERCSCYNAWKNKQLAKASGIGHLLEKQTFDNFIVEEPWQKAIKEKAENYKDGWFFIGGCVGSGKSFLCTAIMGKYINSGKSALYMLWAEKSKELKRILYDEEYEIEIQKLKDVDMLYIDDLFKVGNKDIDRITSTDINIAFEILNSRYLNNKQTLISSEFTYDELETIDLAIASRIRQMTGDNCLNIKPDINKNFRLKVRK